MLVRSKIYHANELSIDFSRYDIRECRCIGPLLNAKRNEPLCCLNGLMREPYKIARDDRILSVTIEYGLGILLARGAQSQTRSVQYLRSLHTEWQQTVSTLCLYNANSCFGLS